MKNIIIALVAIFAHFAQISAQTFTNPVFSTYWGSPHLNVVKGDDGKYYAFIHEGWGRVSSDLVNWTDTQRVAAEADHYTGNFTLKMPSVNKIGNRYVMFYEALNRDNGCGESICINVSDSPAGYFAPLGGNNSSESILLHKDRVGAPSIWDPAFVHDPKSGRNFLVYSAAGIGNCAIELSADGLSLAPGATPVKISAEGLTQPYVYYRDGYFYLFVTAREQMAPVNGWDVGDKRKVIAVGRSESPVGPYVDAAGNRMLDGYYHQVMAGHPFHFTDPERPSIVTDAKGQDWVVYNAWQVGADIVDPIMMLDKVRWVNGWPVFADGYPSYYPVGL